LPASLVREVLPAPTRPLVDPSDNLSSLPSPRCTFRFPGQPTLGFSKSSLLGPEEARVLDHLTRGEGGEGRQPDIDPDWTGNLGQSGRLPVAGDRDVPFAG